MKKWFKKYYVLILMELICIGLTVGMVSGIKTELKYMAAIEGGVIVKADTTWIRTAARGPNNSYVYKIYYRYIDENNIEYEGHTGENIFIAPEDDEKYAGRPVDIYIDGKGCCIMVGYEPSCTTPIVLTVIFSVASIGLLVFMIAHPIVARKKREKKAEIAEAIQTNDKA